MGDLSLHEDNIVMGLDALNREDALKKIVDALPSWILPEIEKKKIFQRLVLRERIGTTAIGHGIALPHCFSSEVPEPIMAFGVSPMGISFPSLDGGPVHFIFVLILPQNGEAENQKRRILQNVKWVLCDRFMQERLKSAQTASEVLQWMVPEVNQVPVLRV